MLIAALAAWPGVMGGGLPPEVSLVAEDLAPVCR